MFKIIIIFIVSFYYISHCTGDPEIQKSRTLEKELEKKQFSSCFEELGCLDTTDEWYHNKFRPHNSEPLDRHTIRTEFSLITKNDTATTNLNFETLTLRKDLLSAMNYTFDLGIIFLIHDFTSNGLTGWIKHIAIALLNRKELNANVISVDWEAGAEPPFQQAIANARVVALEIKHFIKTIKNFTTSKGEESKPLKIHIIGHGVGAHIAGYVGSYEPVLKITGLDPTGPSFDHMPFIVRLDPGDAKYVEVLHTDAFNHKSQGSKETLGHADFFLNNANIQPLCNQSAKYSILTAVDRNSLAEGTILPACSHKRAFKYYIEALDNKDCEFTGFNCESYEHFIDGKCTSCGEGGEKSSKCATFGFVEPAGHASKNYYLNTNGEPPYCMNAYKIDITIDRLSKSKSPQKGYFELIMLDENGIMTNAVPSGRGLSHNFESGQTYAFVYYAPSPRISKIVEGRLKWLHNPNTLCVFCTTSISVNQVVVRLLTASKPRSEESVLRSKLQNTEIESNSYAIFTRRSEVQVEQPHNKTCPHN